MDFQPPEQDKAEDMVEVPRPLDPEDKPLVLGDKPLDLGDKPLDPEDKAEDKVEDRLPRRPGVDKAVGSARHWRMAVGSRHDDGHCWNSADNLEATECSSTLPVP